ncbi:hypothetical protein AYK24_04015 [Thermoplasmatales archaeon SG8-52-4]|nr:MAG: hypothetical protein AYK24_04015 [Thermoplasmatales archaeon SG8-52-4]
MFKFIRSKNKIIILFLLFVLLVNFISFQTNAQNSLADLVPYSFDAPPSPWIAEEEIEIIFRIENIGTKNVSTNEVIEVGLFLDSDQNPVATNSSNDGLQMGKTCYVNISWVPYIADGNEHNLKIFVNYNSKIKELSYTNNYWLFKVVFKEKDTELTIESIDVSDDITAGTTTNIIAKIKNNGKKTDKIIYAKLNSSEGEIQTLKKVGGLNKNQVYNFNFQWTPSFFGTHILTVDLLLVNKTHDYKEKKINVGVGKLDWWNKNWHYRYFLTLMGSGNVSHFFNFTELTEDLGIISSDFENDTIRVIRYSNLGKVIEEVNDYRFIENINDYTSGELLWKVPKNPTEKYYCIYFDLETNPGIRTSIEENEAMLESGGITVTSGFIDGWHVTIKHPVDNMYTLIQDSINISVLTDAKAKEVNALIYLESNESVNSSINLIDIEEQINWSYKNFKFEKDGNWIVRVNSIDDAGYLPPAVEHSILVGNPDFEIINMSILSESEPSNEIYKFTTIFVSANIISHKATVEDVDVSFFVQDKISNEVKYSEELTITLIKDKIINISFEWYANISGKYNVKIVIDPQDEIKESNEDNNEKKKEITVYDWPDLSVNDIILPSETIMEFEQVKIEVIVENKGLGEAFNFGIKLFIEEYSEGSGIMKFLNEKDNETINLEPGKTKTVNMYWNSAKAGKWLVGVNILVEGGQRDSNLLNNQKLSDTNLVIKSYEKNKPVISNVVVEPERQQQGGSITIFADITDDSGLKSVKIKYLDPSRVTFNWTNMIRQHGNVFKAVFDDTLLDGKYNFEINALDISVHSNTGIYKDSFEISLDKTNPIISYYEASPRVQLKGKNVEIYFIAKDNIKVNSVKVLITLPDGSELHKTLAHSSEGKYIYNNIYNKTGRYIYEIEVKDKAGNKATINSKFFWITNKLNDNDNDGMPNIWEEKYGFDPENPNDAIDDKDNDGIINKKEYELGTNPLKNIFSENAVARLKDNTFYLIGSIIAFIFIIILSIFDRRIKS